MPHQRIGWTGATLKEIRNSPRIVKTGAGDEVHETFNCNYDDAEAAITARGYDFGDACPIKGGLYSAATLHEIQINKAGVQNGRVVYIWRVPDPNDPTPVVGTITREADSNAIEIPIGQHPDASPGTNYDEQKKIGKGDWEGIESYLSPQPVYSRAEILNSFYFSEINIVKNVGRRFSSAQMNTKGLSAATENAWLKMQLAISTSGENFEKKERWQYADKGWDDYIYSAATAVS